MPIADLLFAFGQKVSENSVQKQMAVKVGNKRPFDVIQNPMYIGSPHKISSLDGSSDYNQLHKKRRTESNQSFPPAFSTPVRANPEHENEREKERTRQESSDMLTSSNSNTPVESFSIHVDNNALFE